MTTNVVREPGCLAPVAIDPVVADPEAIRAMARANGPYFMPARYLIDGEAAADARDGRSRRRGDVPAELIGPVWRGDWAVHGQPLVTGVEAILHHDGFIDAARHIFAAEVVVPEQVYVNLTAPKRGDAMSHTDIPEFIGIDRTNVPGWLLQAMNGSGLFEDVRISIATAVAWFHHGDRGFFRYWPNGRDADSVRHEAMWNTAVVGDNDFMHHKVERLGDTPLARDRMTIDTCLDHDGETWVVIDDGQTIATVADADIRLSVSWKARIYATEATRLAVDRGEGAIDVAEVFDRFAAALDEPLAATGPDALTSPALRDQLAGRWSGYRLDR
ncbi:MAG: hypothetical protein OEW85_09060 [Acidimicrobiia bacterium]|nr:hypothetical protein [Acidimicrobiia bacterium]